MSVTVHLPFRGMAPSFGEGVYVAPSAIVIGDVELGVEASVWFHTVVRADVHHIRIGARTNIQDNATVHVTHGTWPTIVGTGVTVGHAAVLHGCTVGDYTLVGIGAVILDGAELGAECLVGARALVTPGTRVPPRSLVLGSPAKAVRALRPDEVARLHESADHYVQYAREYMAAGILS